MTLSSSPGFQWTLLWDWEFLPPLQPLPQDFTVRGVESLVFQSATPTLPVVWLCCGSCPPDCPSPPLLPVWMNVSLTPGLSEFHGVWFSDSSACSLFLNWLLSFFWLCKEAKWFYLCFHLGWNLNNQGHAQVWAWSTEAEDQWMTHN